MMEQKPKILLVMHNVPLESGFLTAKFVELAKVTDCHLLVWDTKKRINKFISTNNLPAGLKRNIHSGIKGISDLLNNAFVLIALLLFNNKIRSYLLEGKGGFAGKLKLISYYLPMFKIQPDIIHFEFGVLAARNSEIIKSLTAAKISASFRGYDINYVGLSNPDYYKELWHTADAFHFLGKDLKNRAVKRGYKNDKLDVLIPPAINTDFFKPGADRIKKKNDKLIIVSAGRLVWKKGIEYGVRAVALLKERNIPIEYRIIGDGEYLQAIQFTIFELGLENEIKLLGKQNAETIKTELENADVFLHPAISEGFCNAVLEAQAMGLPVVCSDADGLSENVVNNITGYVVPKWDVTAMADKLEWCWLNREASLQMGKNGIERVNKYFKLEDQIRAFEQFYQKLYES